MQGLVGVLTEEEKVMVKEMEAALLPNLRYYTNKPERNSYNFWQKSKGKHFPNGHVLNKWSKFQLPDDIDTTSLAQMVVGASYQDALKTKRILPHYANLYRCRIKNGHKQLSKYKAYSTWFGKDMPIEFDVCVLCNYLLWLHRYGFEVNENDQDCISLVVETIDESLYFQSAFRSSPEYPKIEIILYHLARLASITPFVDAVKAKLIQDILLVYDHVEHPYAQMLLQSALLKLGVKRNVNRQSILQYVDTYWWFTAGLLSVYSNTQVQRVAPKSMFHFRFVCPAFNYVLVFENMLLNKTK